MKLARLVVVLFGCALGCAAPAPPPEHLGRKLAIMPVHNRTGDPLIVSGAGLLDGSIFPGETVTVADIFESEAVLQLRGQGFDPVRMPSGQKAWKGPVPTNAAEAAAQARLGPLCLYMEIRRWEPEGRVHVKYVTVDVETSLIDTATRQVLWHLARRGPISTPGQVLLEGAYVAAARKVTAETLAPLRPDPSVTR